MATTSKPSSAAENAIGSPSCGATTCRTASRTTAAAFPSPPARDPRDLEEVVFAGTPFAVTTSPVTSAGCASRLAGTQIGARTVAAETSLRLPATTRGPRDLEEMIFAGPPFAVTTSPVTSEGCASRLAGTQIGARTTAAETSLRLPASARGPRDYEEMVFAGPPFAVTTSPVTIFSASSAGSSGRSKRGRASSDLPPAKLQRIAGSGREPLGLEPSVDASTQNSGADPAVGAAAASAGLIFAAGACDAVCEAAAVFGEAVVAAYAQRQQEQQQPPPQWPQSPPQRQQQQLRGEGARRLGRGERRGRNLRRGVAGGVLSAHTHQHVHHHHHHHMAPCAPHMAPCAPHLAPRAPHLAPCAPHLAPCAPHLAPCAPHLAPCAQHHTTPHIAHRSEGGQLAASADVASGAALEMRLRAELLGRAGTTSRQESAALDG